MNIILEYVRQPVMAFWGTLGEMSPYLLFGFFVAGLLSVLISQEIVQRHLGQRGLGSLAKAAVFGIPLPLCSCGVIPVSMGLHKHGASKGSTISFLLSTPQTGVDSIFVTFSLLGPLFAIYRPLAAFATGIIGGGLVNAFSQRRAEEQAPVEKCTDECCGSQQNRLARALKYGFVTLPGDIGRDLLIGVAIAAAISAAVPENFFSEYLGTGFLAMVVMMFLGIPVYVCATASVPVAAAMIIKGLAPGAALVFLMTGPATNAASIVMIWRSMGTRTVVAYLLAVAGCSLGAGYLLNYIAATGDYNIAEGTARMLPGFVKDISSVVLLAVLGWATASKWFKGKKEQHDHSTEDQHTEN